MPRSNSHIINIVQLEADSKLRADSITFPHTCVMPERFAFSNLREVVAKGNEEKSGDQLAGVAARSEQERVSAKERLADLTLAEIVRQPLIEPDDDDVSRLILETFDQVAFR